MARLIILLIVWNVLASGGNAPAQTREEIEGQLQEVDDLLHDMPERAKEKLDRISQNPALQSDADLRLKTIRLILEYESRTKIFTQTPARLDEGFALLSQVKDPKVEINLLLGKAAYAYEFDRIDGVRTALNRAYEISIRISDVESQAQILCQQGNLDRLELNYQAALIHYLQAFDLIKTRAGTDAYERVANQLALFYLEGLTVRYDQGIKILEDLVQLAETSAKPRRQDRQILVSNLGFAYAKRGLFDKARAAFEKAHTLALEIQDWTGVAYGQLYIGTVLAEEKKWAESLRYHQLAQNYFLKIRNQPRILRGAEKIMSVQLELGDIKGAAENWKIVQTGVEKNMALDQRVEHVRLRGRLAAAQKRWKDAFEAFEQMNSLEDKLNAQKNADSARYYTALFNIERKEQDNKRLEQKGRLQVLQLDNNRKQSEVLSWILISASLIACIFAVDFFRVRKRRNKIRDLTENLQKNLLQRYLPNQVVQDVLAGRQNLDVSPQQRRVTVLHSEICDFPKAVELLGPSRIGRILNTHLGEMMDIIGSEGGMIDKFINGSILAVFGAPQTQDPEAQARAAVRCARRMQERLEELNRSWQSSEGWVFAMRIGLHQAESLVGKVGVESRIDYTVTGPATELALQICSRGSPGDTLVSGTLATHLEADQLFSISRQRTGTDGEIFSLLRASS